MTKRDEAKQDYLAGMKYKEIADKYDVSLSTVKSWKSRYWADETKVATSDKKVATKSQKVTPKTELHPAIQELDESGLNDKQKDFVSEYVRLSNATQAYINAYGVEYNTAMVQGSISLRNPKIKSEIKRLRQARLAELGIGVFDLIDDMAKEARADVRDFADWGSDEFEAIDEESGKQYTKHKSWVALKDSNNVDSWAVKKVTVGKDGPMVELHDRNKARKELLEYLNGKGVFAGTEEEQQVINDDNLLNAIKKSSEGVFKNDDDIES
ncbi:terminase small subunit [Fructobacillus tropaeoli]|uniref:Prophage terminase small subunit n=1 Tax=Fructobacillus tropaeoli TaxID=709323 RepID=A0A3F3H3H6_9LACO|nr:terminase small subunit [Fructobacillus tropaeoli]GAP04896.1 prophage terminase small subunit [Fructobacillus tropaeoli]